MRKSDILVARAKLEDLGERSRDSLPESELRRAEQFKLPRRRREYFGGRILLRSLLERFTGRAGSSHQIVTSDNGKPLCVEGPAVSIAHSADTIVCAVSGEGAIGIDVELPPRPRDAEKIARRFFSEEEAAWIAKDPDERFLMLWVIKEAWLKATGSGIAGGLDSLQCTVVPPGITARVREDRAANLGIFKSQSAFIGLATTVAPHESVNAYRWVPRASNLVEDSTLRLVAATWHDAYE